MFANATAGKKCIDLVDARPNDCDCLDADDELPCWPCYRDGFEDPNPDADA